MEIEIAVHVCLTYGRMKEWKAMDHRTFVQISNIFIAQQQHIRRRVFCIPRGVYFYYTQHHNKSVSHKNISWFLIYTKQSHTTIKEEQMPYNIHTWLHNAVGCMHSFRSHTEHIQTSNNRLSIIFYDNTIFLMSLWLIEDASIM